MTTKSKKKMPERNQSRSKSGGPDLVTNRHAPDGSVVPIDDERKGRTVSQEWDAHEGNLGDFEPVPAGNSETLYESLIRLEPSKEIVSWGDTYHWAETLLRDNGYPGPDPPEAGKLPPPWKLPTKHLEAHSQLMLASQCMSALETVRYACHTNQPLAVAKHAFIAADRYHLAHWKREEEKDALSGAKTRIAGETSARAKSPLYEEARREAGERWARKPAISSRQMAVHLRKLPQFRNNSVHTIRGWISDLNPCRRKKS
jgi:hypothetical protein